MTQTQSWKDKLQPAKFRDVQFYVHSSSTSFGRRVISHEFPFGEAPFTEDLGKKQRSFRLDGFLNGNDYFTKRDKLIVACEQPGSGKLTHPYLGDMQVNCISVSISESTLEGGYASLSFQFIESGDVLTVVTDTNKVAKLTDSTQSIKTSALDNFKQIYTVVDTTKNGIQKAKDAVNQVMDDLNKAQKFCADVAQTGNDLAQLVREVSSGIDKIITYPDRVSGLFETSFGALSTSIDKFNSKNDPKRLMAAASLLGSVSGSFASPNTSSSISTSPQKTSAESDAKRRAAWIGLSQNKINQVQILNSTALEAKTEQKNKSIIELTTNSLALSYLADAASSSSYSNSIELNNTKIVILNLADTILEHPLISDDLFISIQNMQSNLADALSSIQNNMPLISTFKIKNDTNVISFLYENFGNLKNEDDFIKRNNIQDPLNLKAGMQLQVAL